MQTQYEEFQTVQGMKRNPYLGQTSSLTVFLTMGLYIHRTYYGSRGIPGSLISSALIPSSLPNIWTHLTKRPMSTFLLYDIDFLDNTICKQIDS
jgi:hypothetical protein